MLQQQDQGSVQPETKSWYVLYTKPRHEKKLAERLRSEGWTVYCPLKKTTKQWSDRKKMVEEALFPSFIFIQCQDQDRDHVFVHASAVRYLYWLRKPAVVRSEEIESIQKWLGQYNHSNIDITHILPGDFVRITSGPFSDEQAVLLDKTNKKAVVQLKELGIQLTLSLTNCDITAI